MLLMAYNKKRLIFPYHLLNFAPQLLNIRSFVPFASQFIQRHPFLWYQIADVDTIVFVSPKSRFMNAHSGPMRFFNPLY